MKRILTALLLLLTLISLASCDKKIKWPDGRLGSMIPQVEGAKGEIGYESTDSLYITLKDIKENQYLHYIANCKSKGFSVDTSEGSGSFTAFNSDGYKIDISYFSSGDMWIKVNAPISMSTFDWPNSDIAKLLPKPDSNYGKIEWEAESGFRIYVGNATKAEYSSYVNDVYARGFTVNYKKGDDYFYAKNAAGYSVSLKYEGFNTMFVRIDAPEAVPPETSVSDITSAIDSSNNNDTDNSPESTSSEPVSSMHPESTSGEPVSSMHPESTSGEPVSSMRPEFKEAMDSYEAFIDEYCSFMKKYNSPGDHSDMLNDYLSYMSRYSEVTSKFNALKNEKMNSIELLYYAEVVARTNQKILEATQS